MNEQYSSYLNSAAWQKKRQQRLAISQHRCSACTERKAVHVHHLTYERIFNEDMADLLPLCEKHHRIAERLIAKGKLTRRGDVLFLAAETMRLIVGAKKEPRRPKPHLLPDAARKSITLRNGIMIDGRTDVQLALLGSPYFTDALVAFAENRDGFKAHIEFWRIAPFKRGTLMNNGCILFDRMKRNIKRAQRYRESVWRN